MSKVKVEIQKSKFENNQNLEFPVCSYNELSKAVYMLTYDSQGDCIKVISLFSGEILENKYKNIDQYFEYNPNEKLVETELKVVV